MKELILHVCTVRNDDYAEVRIKVEGTICDLHATDARYHVDCKARFLAFYNVSCAAEKCSKDEKVDSSLEYVTDVMATSSSYTATA